MSNLIESPDSSEIPEASADEVSAVEALLNGIELPDKASKAPEKAPETAPDDAPGGDANAAEEEDELELDSEGEQDEQSSADAKAFYAQEVKLSNGETMTVGQMKDLAQDYQAKTVDLIERENGVLRQRNELEEMGQYLQLPPEVRERIQQQQAQYLSQEHNRMLSAIPEFKDQAAFEKGRVAIFELGAEYGVDLSRVTDHRVVKMLHDFARIKSGIKAAKDNVKQIKTAEPKAIPRRVSGKASALNDAVTRAKQTGNEADQARAVELLLKD